MHRTSYYYVYNLDKDFTSLDSDWCGFVPYIYYLDLGGFVRDIIPPFDWILGWHYEFPGKGRCALPIAVLFRRLAAGGPKQR